MGVEWLLATPVQFYAGARFYRVGFAELRHFNPGMNSLEGEGVDLGSISPDKQPIHAKCFFPGM